MSVFTLNFDEKWWLFFFAILLVFFVIIIILLSLKKKTKMQNEVLENIEATLKVTVANLENIMNKSTNSLEIENMLNSYLFSIEDNLTEIKKILKNIKKGIRGFDSFTESRLKTEKISMQIDYLEKMIMLENRKKFSESKNEKLPDKKIKSCQEEQKDDLLEKILMAQKGEPLVEYNSKMERIGLIGKKNNVGRSGKVYTREEIEDTIK